MNWDTSIRATDGYDNDNTTDWHYNLAIPELQELRPDFIQTHWDDAKNKIFIRTVPSEYDYTNNVPTISGGEIDTNDETGNLSSARELIVYSTARSTQFLIHIGLWFRKILRGE